MAAEPTPGSLRAGYLYGLTAFVLWGLFPIYFKWLGHVPAIELAAHRILWSVPLLVGFAAIGGQWRSFASLFTPRLLAVFLASSIAVGATWFLYIWAIAADRLLEASLGYYITPLMLALFGVAFLKERPSRLQWIAIALAAIGVGVLIFRFGAIPWVALTLALVQPAYTLIRKLTPADAVSGLLLETLMLTPFTLALLVWLGPTSATAQADLPTWGLLSLAGVVTAIPLILFLAAARRLPLIALGLLQFISPSLNFLLAVGLFGETFTPTHMIAFGFIWVALALHTFAGARKRPA